MRKYFLGFGLAPVAVPCLALALYLPGFWWGAPYATAPDRTHSWGVDDETPLGPLAEIHNIIEPKPDRNLGYPLMHPLLVSVAYTPYLSYLVLTKQLSLTGSGIYPFGLIDPIETLRNLTFIAHVVSVLMGVGIVLALYETTAVVWDRQTGVLAAMFGMVCYPMFYYVRNANVDVPMLFFVSLAVAAFTRCCIHGYTTRRVLWLGAFIGFSIGTKEPAVGAFLLFPLAFWGCYQPEGKLSPRSKAPSFWKLGLVCLFSTFLAFGFGSGLFIDPERYVAHLNFISGRLEYLSSGNTPVALTFPFTWEGHVQYLEKIGEYLMDGMTVPGLLLAVVGIGVVLTKERALLFLGAPALGYLVFLFFALRSGQIRYVMPAAVLLAFFQARAVTFGWKSRTVVVRWGILFLMCLSLAIGLLRGFDLTYEMIYDSRYEAGEWLASRTKAGDRIEYFGTPEKLPPVMAGIITSNAIPYFGMHVAPPDENEATHTILQNWEERKPTFVITIPDLTSSKGVPHNHTCPPKIFAGLMSGTIGYQLAGFFQTPRLFPWLPKPQLDYPTVNPPIHIFVRQT